jgi:hypothetical protein
MHRAIQTNEQKLTVQSRLANEVATVWSKRTRCGKAFVSFRPTIGVGVDSA